MTFADKLQSLRKGKGFSQEDLAEKCGITRQSVSKWETGHGYPETEKLLLLCDLLDVNLDDLLRDTSNAPNAKNRPEQTSAYTPHIGKWLQVFLKDKEFSGFYCVGLVAIRSTLLLFMDHKGKAILIDTSSVSTICSFTNERQMKKLPAIPSGETITNLGESFTNKKCNIKLKQEHPLLGVQKPGGFYAVLVTRISDGAVAARDEKGGTITVKMSDVLFIKECP